VCVAAVKRADASIHVAAGGLVELLEEFDLTELDDDGKDYISWLFREAEDAWASAEYRQNLSQVLLARVLQKLERIV
jgi:CO/xanthine dehydrogenase FAD-binding subunit